MDVMNQSEKMPKHKTMVISKVQLIGVVGQNRLVNSADHRLRLNRKAKSRAVPPAKNADSLRLKYIFQIPDSDLLMPASAPLLASAWPASHRLKPNSTFNARIIFRNNSGAISRAGQFHASAWLNLIQPLNPGSSSVSFSRRAPLARRISKGKILRLPPAARLVKVAFPLPLFSRVRL